MSPPREPRNKRRGRTRRKPSRQRVYPPIEPRLRELLDAIDVASSPLESVVELHPRSAELTRPLLSREVSSVDLTKMRKSLSTTQCSTLRKAFSAAASGAPSYGSLSAVQIGYRCTQNTVDSLIRKRLAFRNRVTTLPLREFENTLYHAPYLTAAGLRVAAALQDDPAEVLRMWEEREAAMCELRAKRKQCYLRASAVASQLEELLGAVDPQRAEEIREEMRSHIDDLKLHWWRGELSADLEISIDAKELSQLADSVAGGSAQH